MYTNPNFKPNINANTECVSTVNENGQVCPPQITIGDRMKEIYDKMDVLKNYLLSLNDFITDPVNPDDIETHWTVDMSNVNNFFNAVTDDISVLNTILSNILKRCY